ncbi:MAG: hypothetical protein ACK515_02620 [bacterium]|jgi:hypothetical protein
MDSAEIRLRIVEALCRTDGSLAKNQPAVFLERVAEIERFVVGSQQVTEPAKPDRKSKDKKEEPFPFD